MTDNVTGIVLDIPPTVLQNIKDADKAIKDLEQTSLKAARNIKFDFDTTMVNGVDAFIRKVQEAQTKLGGLKMPTIDASGLSSAIQALSQAMATIDKSATTGSNRLTRIANAMTALQGANPDPQLFQNIADGITKIGNTSQQTIQNVSQLAQVMAQLAKDIRTVQQAQNAQNANTATAAQYNKLYKEQANIIREINRLKNLPTRTNEEEALLKRLRTRYAELATEIFNLDKKRQSAASNLAKFRGQLNSATAFNTSTPTGAINYAKQAQSLNQLQAAYKNLKAVMATTNPDSSAWRQMNSVLGQTRTRIDEVKKSMGEFKRHASQVGDIAGQLKRALAATFSISAITGYINKLIETRAQFELQQTALRAILQDKQEADKIFQQVQQMALQSPFSIMQMTTFTKQLAAYRVEADKLVGTTKMLADVSAGLGVDMGRLILAYGQVKAANYLRACLGRGTKVKMFDGTFKNVEDIVVGDVLMGDDEQPRNVSKLYQGEQQMYRVSYLGGSFRCNEHHILTVYDALKMRVSDVFVLDYLKEPYRYHGVKRIGGEYKTFIMKVEPDNIDTYYGFSIDGNHRFIIEDNIVTHNTEVRQFTEAGLNIAGELATYFSELQGKMVSVGDVMEMITKRMVRFEDVEEVFKRVTSAGGLFYDMQKKQSETLWGQLQRIKDAMSIMFNEIGKSDQGAISTVLTTIRSLINNWRELATIINSAGVAMAAFFSIKLIRAFIALWPKLIAQVALYASNIAWAVKNMKNLRTAISMISATGWGAIIAGVALLATTIYQAVTATSALQEELSRMGEESMTDMYDAIFKFKELADTAKDATKSYKERAEAMESLNRTYKDILPSEMLEIENIRKMSDGYKEATDAIREYYTESAKKKAEETIRNDQEQAWNTLIQHAKDMAGYLKSGQPDLEELPTATLKGLIGKSMLELKKEIDDGTTDVTDAWVRFKQLFKQTSGLNIQDNFGTRGFRSLFGEFTLTYSDFYDDILDISERGREAQVEFDAQYTAGFSQESKALIAEYDKRKEAVKNFYDALMNYASLQQKGELKNKSGNLTELGAQATREMDAAKASMNQLLGQLGETQIGWDGIKTATENNTDALLLFDNVQKTVMGRFLTNIQKTANDTSIQAWAQKAQRELQNMGLSDLQMDIISLAKESATANKMQISMLDKLKISAETNYTSAAKDAKALSGQAIDNISKIQATRIQLMALGRTASEAEAEAEAKHGNGSTEKELQAEAEWWEKLAKLYGDYEKKKDKGRKKDIWTPRLNLMQKVNKEYEKLLKYYSKEEAMTRIRTSYGDAVAEAFKGTQWADISKWGGFDAQATIDRLKQLATKAGKEDKKKILEAVGTLQAELDIKIEEKNIQEAKDKIQSLFDNYELTKTLGGLGLNIDLTYLVGGRPVKIEDLRKQLEAELSNVKATGGEEDTVKAYEDALRKVTDLENKAAVERLKNYNKYLLESMSERVQIELKAQQEISKIRQDATLDDFSKEQAINNVRKKMQEDLTKYDFDQFKGSDVYLQTFKDLERASKTQLRYVIDRLKELQAVNKDLSPLQVKSIAQEIKKAEDALAKQESIKNLAANFKEAIGYAKHRNQLLSEQVRLQSELTAAELEQSEAEKELNALTMQRDAIQDKSSFLWKTMNVLVEAQRKKFEDIVKKTEKLGIELKNITNEIEDGEDATDGLNETWNNIANTLNAVSSAISDISEGLDAMGLLSDGLSDAFSSAQSILGSAVQVGSGAVQAFTDPTPWGKMQGAISAVGGAVKLVGSIFSIGDKKKERQIKRLQEKVENLQKAYEKLQTAIEEAYTFDDYNAGYNQSMRNLQEHRAAIQEQLALEKSKKKSDKDKIREYEDALDELAEKEKELRDARYEALGSVSQKGVLSEAGNFVSAWLDAYKETGDGLDALNEHWNEFFENLVLKQASSAVVSRRMKKYIEQINAAIDSGDTGLSLSQTFAQIGQNLKNELGTWNEDLKAFFDAVGIKGGQGKLLLSDLQKGIQNITEPQAAAIESYLNSMRFAVFEQNNILTEMLSAIQAQYGSNDNSPMLQEVRAIRSLVASIDDRLSRVIVQRSSVNTGYAVVVK